MRSGTPASPVLGVRVRPSGGRSYVMLQEVGGRSKRVSLGSVSTKSIAEARRECLARQAGLGPGNAPGPAHAVPLFRDFVTVRVERGSLRALQALDAKRRAILAWQATAAHLRFEAAGPDFPGKDRALVRRIQRDRAGQCQSCSRTSPADHELRDRLRSHRHQPGAGHEMQPAAGPHALLVGGGDRSPSSHAGQTNPKEQPAAGRHHPPPVADRMPQDGDRPPALVRGPGRHDCARGQQDGTEKGSSQHAGQTCARTSTAKRECLRVSFPARPGPTARPQSGALVSGPW